MSEEIDSISLGLEGDASSLLSAFTRSLSALDKFHAGVTGKSAAIKASLDDTFTGAAKTLSILNNGVRLLEKTLKDYSDAQDKAAGSTAKGADGAEKAAKATKENTDAVRRLTLEYRAGTLSFDQYISKLKDVAATSKSGSDKQLTALAQVRDAQNKNAQATEQAAKREAAAVEKFARASEVSLSRVLRMTEMVANGLQSAGRNLTKFVSLPLVGAGTYSIKVGVDYDKAFNEVKKFAGATDEELAKLEKGLRELSLDPTVGTDFEGLAKIAASGAQLGVAKDNLIEFTRDMAYAGKSGDITGDEISEGMAKINAALKGPPSQIKNLTSALVKMGNEGASKMGEVKNTALRFAAETRLVKMQPSDLLAYSNAVVGLGQNAEAAGNGLARSFEKADEAVNEGGPKLAAWANAAGMSAKQFAKAWRDDAGSAFLAFLAGMDKAGETAGRVDKILKGLSISDRDDKTGIKNLAGDWQKLAQYRESAAQAFVKADEQEKKAKIAAETYANQLGQLQRELKDSAYELSKVLVPALLDVVHAGKPLVDGIHDLAVQFHNMSPEAQQAWLKVAMGLVLMGPLVSGLGNVVGWVVKLREAFVLMKAMQAAQELSAAAKALTDVANASSGTVSGINAVATAGATATSEVGLLSRALAALASTSPITVPIIIAAAIAGAVAKASIDNSEANIAKMEESGAETARTEIAEARKTIAGLKEYKAQLQNAGYAVSKVPDGEMRGKLGISAWDAPGRPNLDNVLGKQGANGKRMGGSIDRVIAEEEARIKRNQGIITGAGRQAGREKANGAIESAASQADSEIGKNIVRSASRLKFDNMEAGCATYVSKVLQAAGAQIGVIPIAKDLRDNLLKQGGKAKDMKDAKPGDIVFFEGKAFGAIKDKTGKGYHTGVYLGGGMIRDEGSKGVRTRSVASIAGSDKNAVVYAVSVPERLGTSRGVRALNGDVPFDSSLYDTKPKKGKAAPAYRAPVAEPTLEDLTPLEELFSGKKLSTLPTSAKNYADKKREMEEAFAERRLKAVESGKPLDDYTDGKQNFNQSRTLASNAIRNTESAIKATLPKVEAGENAVRTAHAALNGLIQAMNAKRAAHQQSTDAEQKQYAQASKAYRDAKKQYGDDKAALEENRRVHAQAIGDKTSAIEGLAKLEEDHREKTRKAEEKSLEDRRKKWLADLKTRLEQGKISRTQYEAELAAGVGRIGKGTEQAGPAETALTDSETDRKNATDALRRKTLGLDGKNFAAERQALKDELAESRRKGVDEKEVAAYETGRNREIDLSEWQHDFHEAQEKFKADLDDGKESLASYKDFLGRSLDGAIEKFGESSVEASKLHREIDHVTWQQADDSANQFRQSLDNGDLSIQQYIARLKQLQATLPESSNAYRKMGSEIDSANRKMVQDAHATADRIGAEFGQGMVRALRRQSSFAGVIRDMFTRAVDDAVAAAIRRLVAAAIFRALNKGNEAKVAAEDKQVQAATMQQVAAVEMDKSALLVKKATGEFDAAVTRLLAAGPLLGDGSGSVGVAGAGALGGIFSSATDPHDDATSTVGSIVATVKKGIGKVKDVASVANAVKDGDIKGAVTSAASAGWMGKAVGAAIPYVGAALAVGSLLSSFMGGAQKPDYVTKKGNGKFASLGDGDHTGLIDSGYSGMDGMRQLQATRDARSRTNDAASRGVQTTNQFAQGSIIVHAAPGQSASEIASEVLRQAEERSRIENSLNGTG